MHTAATQTPISPLETLAWPGEGAGTDSLQKSPGDTKVPSRSSNHSWELLSRRHKARAVPSKAVVVPIS